MKVYSLLKAFYNSTPPTIASASEGFLQVDANGNLLVNPALGAGEDQTNNVQAVIQKPQAIATYSPSVYAPLTQVTKANIKASVGNLLSVYVTNLNAAIRYLQIHNKASAPAGADVPLISLPIPAGTSTFPGSIILDNTFFTQAGINLSLGIGFAISTTFGTFTDSATASDHIIVATYV